jgi:hypothetical protein
VGRTRTGTIALLIVGVPVLIGFAVYGPYAFDLLFHRRSPSRFLIPDGFHGWIRITYGVPGAPPLGREGKYRVVKLRPDGTAETSSDLPGGWGHDEFFYDDGSSWHHLSNAGWCKGGMIWDESVESDSKGTETLQKFFVGTEDEFRLAIDPKGRIHSPCG